MKLLMQGRTGMRLLIVRHAQSEHNLKTGYFGEVDPPLSHDGELQAKELGRRLRARDLTIHLYTSSTLTRAKETLRLATREFTIELVRPGTDHRLNEISRGQWTGYRINDILTTEKERQLFYRSPQLSAPNGESMEYVGDRIVSAINDVISTLHGMGNVDAPTAIIVTHSRAIQALLWKALEYPFEYACQVQIENTSIIELVYRADLGWCLQL